MLTPKGILGKEHEYVPFRQSLHQEGFGPRQIETFEYCLSHTKGYPDLSEGLRIVERYGKVEMIHSDDLPEAIRRLRDYLKEIVEVEIVSHDSPGNDIVSRIQASPGEVLQFRGGFVNQALRDARRAFGLTQAELGLIVRARVKQHISTSSAKQIIGRLETLREYPEPSLAQTISEILERPVAELFPPWLELCRQERAIQDIPIEALTRPLELLNRREKLQIEAYTLDQQVDPEEEALKSELRRTLKELLESEAFSDEEAQVVKARYGLTDGIHKTLKQTAQALGYSKTTERVRQVEARALAKLRHPALSRRLKGFIDPNHFS